VWGGDGGAVADGLRAVFVGGGGGVVGSVDLVRGRSDHTLIPGWPRWSFGEEEGRLLALPLSPVLK
jgi:hypothetical protein